MINLLAEQPMLLSLMLAACSGALFFGWLQTGKRGAAGSGLVFLALIPVVHLIAAKWETDREQIESLLYELADAVESNDAERAVKVIGDPELRDRARAELSRYQFTLAAINKIRRIDLIEGTFPQEADVELSAKVDVSDRRGQIQNVRVLRLLILRMEARSGTWVVVDYQHFPITGKPDAASQFSNTPRRP